MKAEGFCCGKIALYKVETKDGWKYFCRDCREKAIAAAKQSNLEQSSKHAVDSMLVGNRY